MATLRVAPAEPWFQLFQVEESNELNAALTSLKLKFASFETERREINELRSAHTSQNQLLQKLQDKVTMELQIWRINLLYT